MASRSSVEIKQETPAPARARVARSRVPRLAWFPTPRVSAAPSPIERRWLRRVILLLVVATVTVSYVFIISAGKWGDWPKLGRHYDWLADGFRSGHLHVSVEPLPALVAQARPLDAANKHLWAWDMSYHQGHYYLYWGPVPAAVIAAVKAIFGIQGVVGDQYPLFYGYLIYALAGAALIAGMARRLFPRTPLWLVALSILVFAFANPTPFLLASPRIYAAAIAAEQAFLVLGLLLAFRALGRADPNDRPARLLMVAAGASWGLAFGCRGSAALPVPLLVVLTALAASPPHGGRRSWLAPLRAAALAAAPVAAAVAAFLLYNKLRFQSWLDFGLSKQLTTTPFRTDPSYFWPNLYSYLLRPLQRSCKFPFMSALPNDGHYPHWLVSPAAYARREPIAGLMATTPWIWFGAIAVFVLGRAVLRGWRDRGASLAIDRDARLRLWCALSFLTLGTTTGLPVITEFFASMRFVGDVAAGLVLLSIWGAWTLYQAVINRPWLRRATATAIVLAASVTVVTGLLLGFEGYERSFETGNPALFEHLSRALSICGR